MLYCNFFFRDGGDVDSGPLFFEGLSEVEEVVESPPDFEGAELVIAGDEVGGESFDGIDEWFRDFNDDHLRISHRWVRFKAGCYRILGCGVLGFPPSIGLLTIISIRIATLSALGHIIIEIECCSISTE